VVPGFQDKTVPDPQAGQGEKMGQRKKDIPPFIPVDRSGYFFGMDDDGGYGIFGDTQGELIKGTYKIPHKTP
jgi:hypothetical protein